MHVDHPQVGELRLNREKLDISGTAGQMLVIYHPDPGTENADKLALLASAMLTPAAPQAGSAEAGARLPRLIGEQPRESVQQRGEAAFEGLVHPRFSPRCPAFERRPVAAQPGVGSGRDHL
jgi:MmyB-like transcription regulator ligand binding domain